MVKFDVAVRAYIFATRVDPNVVNKIEDWEIFNFEPLFNGEDGVPEQYCIGCDRNIVVEASDEIDAVEIAKRLSLPIVMDGWKVEFSSIEVDRDVDVSVHCGEKFEYSMVA